MNEFRELYNNVFDNSGNVKNCGRDMCSKLIIAAQSLTDADCGNPITGVMNITTIKSLVGRR